MSGACGETTTGTCMWIERGRLYVLKALPAYSTTGKGSHWIYTGRQYCIPYRRDIAPVSKECRSCISAGGKGVLTCSLQH